MLHRFSIDGESETRSGGPPSLRSLRLKFVEGSLPWTGSTMSGSLLWLTEPVPRSGVIEEMSMLFRSLNVAASAGVNHDSIAGFHKQRHVHFGVGFKCGRFLHVALGVTFVARLGVRHRVFHLNW